MRAAASSMASGIPSRRAQIAATGSRALGGQREVRPDRLGTGHEEPDGLPAQQRVRVGRRRRRERGDLHGAQSRRVHRRGQSRHRVLLLARDPQRGPAGRDDRQVGRRRSSSAMPVTASSTCSMLSRTIRTRRPASSWASRSSVGRAGSSAIPIACAIVSARARDPGSAQGRRTRRRRGSPRRPSRRAGATGGSCRFHRGRSASGVASAPAGRSPRPAPCPGRRSS